MKAIHAATLLAAPLWTIGLFTAGPSFAATPEPDKVVLVGFLSPPAASEEFATQSADAESDLAGLSERIRREVAELVGDWQASSGGWPADHDEDEHGIQWTHEHWGLPVDLDLGWAAGHGEQHDAGQEPPAVAPAPPVAVSAPDASSAGPAAPALSTASAEAVAVEVLAEGAEVVGADSVVEPTPAIADAISEPRFLTELTAAQPAVAPASDAERGGSPLGFLALTGAACVLGAAAVGRLTEPTAAAQFRRDVRSALRTRKPTATP